MNKQINYEDTIFILNVRIRMIRDLLHLDTDSEVFLRQTLVDMEFINSTIDILSKKLVANTKFLDWELEASSLSDTEWQFNQLLNEFSRNSSPFSPVRFPETATWISRLKEESIRRQELVDTFIPVEQSRMEPVVSQAELNGLLGAV